MDKPKGGLVLPDIMAFRKPAAGAVTEEAKKPAFGGGKFGAAMRNKEEAKKEVELPKPTLTLLLATIEENSALEQILGKYFILTVATDKTVID